MAAPIIGSLNPGTVYESIGYVVVNTDEIWFLLLNYEGGPGPLGFSSRTALTANAKCAQINLYEQAVSRGEHGGIENGNLAPILTPEQRNDDSTLGAADGLAISTPGPGVVEALPVCYWTNGKLDVCGCSSSDGECLSFLVTLCSAIGGQFEPGPETSACWNEAEIAQPTPVFGDLAISTPGPGILEAEPTCNESGSVCWCSASDGECLVELIAGCQGEGDLLIPDPDVPMCSHPPAPSGD